MKGFFSMIGLVISLIIMVILIMIWLNYYGKVFDNLKGVTGGSGTNILEIPEILEEQQNVERQKMEEKIKEMLE